MNLHQWSVLFLFGAAMASGAGLSFQEHAAVQESLGRMPAKFRAEWLLKRGLDASRYTEYRRPESTGLRLVGKYGRGPSNEVTGRGNLVALTLGSEVALLNFANPESPVVLSEIQLNFIPRQTALHDSFLLTCGNGIEIWNIADSTHPVYRNVIPYGVGDFAIVDTFLYFGSWGTFYAYSIANAASPYELGRCADSGYVTTATRNVAVLRELDDVLGFIDVSNPAAPHRVGTYPSYALDADARGNICCAAIYWSTDEDHFRFEVLDISDPANVHRIGAIDSCGGWDIHLSGPFAFVSGFQTSEWEFTMVNLQDSTHPHVVSSCATPSNNYGVWAEWTSNWAYVADMTGLAVIDVTNLNSPVYDTTVLAAGEAQDVWLDHDRAYVADGAAGLRILDVTDPASPGEFGGIDTLNGDSYTAVARDSFAFVGWMDGPHLRSISVADPAHPVMAGGVGGLTVPCDMTLRDSLVYLAGRLRLQIVNVARPRQPVLVGSCVLQNTGTDIFLRDSLAYVAALNLVVINVTRPDSPQVIFQGLSGAEGLDVVDTVAYLAHDGLKTASVANPAAPYLLDSASVTDFITDVVVMDTLAVLSGRKLYIYSVADPRSIRLLGTWTAPGWAYRLLYQPPYVYVACWDAGVCVLETTQTGVTESRPPMGRPQTIQVIPTVTAGRLRVVATDGTVLLDVSGRKVLALHPGSNDVRALAPGVYFVREQPSLASPKPQSVRKVVLTE